MASKDKAGKEERKKPKMDIKEKRKAKIEKKKAGTVITPNAQSHATRPGIYKGAWQFFNKTSQKNIKRGRFSYT